MDRVTGKYMRIGYRDEKCKILPHPAPLPCLVVISRPNAIVLGE